VRHLEAGDRQHGSRRTENTFLRAADPLCHHHHVGQCLLVEFCEPLGLLPRHDEHVSVSERVDAGEGDTHRISPDEPAGQLAVDDAREQRGHSPHPPISRGRPAG
jgi:hypothetical protein